MSASIQLPAHIRFSTTMVSFSFFSALVVFAATVAGSKRGFAVNDEVDISKGGVTLNGFKSKISWTYNWDSTTRKKQPYAEFVPMLWGTQSYHTNQWATNANLWLSRGTKHLLGFNEPERSDQAALAPQQAADAWRKYMNQFSGRAKLGAPAVSNDGYNWLKDFLGKCHDCHIDFVPVHWYNDHTLERDLEDWVNKICSLVGNRKVWITEVSTLQFLLWVGNSDRSVVQGIWKRGSAAPVHEEGPSLVGQQGLHRALRLLWHS